MYVCMCVLSLCMYLVYVCMYLVYACMCVLSSCMYVCMYLVWYDAKRTYGKWKSILTSALDGDEW
jgi:Flp pilus assembly protein TadB